jgi:hypothetical protein
MRQRIGYRWEDTPRDEEAAIDIIGFA